MLTLRSMTGLDGAPVRVRAETVEELRAAFRDRSFQPGDAGYDDAVRIWNGMITDRPALVVQPLSVDDVRLAVGFARANGVLLSVKGGGHNIAGTALADGGMTLDMSRMRRIDVDADRRLAHVGAGCQLGDVDGATQEHGLATVLGSDADTGLAGLTLGGGFGYLSRRFGWTVDNLEEVEVVTAGGEVLRAAHDEHPDLFWALRGGGGNFGVVTRFTYRLHEVGPQVTGGLVIWDGEQADRVLALYREISEAAPRELALVLAMRVAPPAPFIPERWHGRPIIAMVACHTGGLSDAAADLAPIRGFGTPIVDRVVQKPYVDQQFMLGVPQPRGLHYYWKSEFLATLPDEFLRTARSQAEQVTSRMSQVIIFQLGGAVADLASDAAAFGNRDAMHIVFAAGSWDPGDPDGLRHRAWVRSAWHAMRPYSTGGNYINVQTADEDESRTREAYRDTMERLATAKAAYDPDNLFRVNRNIPTTA